MNLGAARSIAAQDPSGPDVARRRIAKGEACRFLASDALSRRCSGEAVDWFLRAIGANPLAIEYRLDLIHLVLLPMGFVEMAKEVAEVVTRLEPILAPIDPVRGNGSHGWSTLAQIHRSVGDRHAAEAAIARAIAACPGDPDVIQTQGLIAADTGRFEEAAECYARLMAIPGRRTKALECAGLLKSRLCEFDEAIALLDEALARPDVNETEAAWLRAEALMTKGDYEAGWKGHQRRLEMKPSMSGSVAGARFLAPLWEPGGPPQRVHVHYEAGRGDMICMARYLPMLAALGHDVRFEVDAEMLDLFRHSFEGRGVRVVRRALDFPGSIGIEAFDSHIPAMSLPTLFGTRLDTIPWSGPYLHADIERVARFASMCAAPAGALRVGLCWSSGPRPGGLWQTEFAQRKSLDLDEMGRAGLFQIPNTRWLSLQAGGRTAHEGTGYRAIARACGIAEVLPEAPTWADTAAIVANCDLVLTVDTGVAHLVGAMGAPGIVMLHAHPTWHFGSPDPAQPWYRRSMWYPGLRVVRQKKPNEWRQVIAIVGDAITRSTRLDLVA